MRKIIFYIYVLTFIFKLNTYADISGVLYEKGKKVKLSAVNVYLPTENLQVVTDKNGEFTFKTTIDAAEVKINTSGFMPYSQVLSNGNTTEIYLEKKELSQSLSLTVEDTNYKKDQSIKSLTRQQVYDMPGANGDAVKAVQNLPGVNRAQGFSSKIIIQGSAPQDTVYDFEGHAIPLIFHFGGLSSVVMPEAVDKVDFYSAGYQAEHSRALGGIVSLSTRDPDVAERDLKSLFYIDNLSLGGLIEGKINDKSSFLFSGRYSYVGFFLKSIMKNNEALNLTVAPEFYDITGVYKYQISDNEKLKISLLTSSDKLAFLFNEPLRQDPSIRGSFSNTINFFRIVPAWEKQFDLNNLLKFSFSYGEDKINTIIGDNYFDLKTSSFSARSRWEYKINSEMNLNSGFDVVHSKTDVGLRLPVTSSEGGISNPTSSGEVRETNVTVSSTNPGFFSEFEYNLSQYFKLIPGLRADYFALTNEFFIFPRLNAQYKLSDSLIYKFGSGLYIQPPEPQEINSDFGNPDVKSPHALHLTLGFDKDFKTGNTNGSFFSMNGFFRQFDHLIISSKNKIIRNGVEVFELYNNDGSGQSYGIENQWKYQIDNLQIVLGYTWSKSTRKTPILGEYNFEYDQTHNLNLMGTYELPNNWKISSRYRYVTGNPYTPVIGAVYDADHETYFPIRGSIYSSRNSPFQQLDVRIDKKIILDREIWTFYLDIQNILNIKNSEGLQYSYDYSTKQDVTGLPLLPSIGVKGEF